MPGLSSGELGGLVVLGTLAVVLGGGLLYDGLRRLRFRRRALSEFEPVDATVVASVAHAPAGRASRAIPEIEYEYTVDGETYTSRTLWPTLDDGPGRVDADVARRIVEDHPEGATVIARYDPEAPGEAYLIDQVSTTGPRLEVAVGGGLLVAFVAAALAVGAGLL